MSVHANYQGGIERSTEGLLLTGTSRTDVFTAYDNRGLVDTFSVVNNSASAVIVTLEFYDSTAAAYRIIWRKEVAANDTEVINDLPQRLYENDKIAATAATGNVITVNLVIVRSYASEPAVNPVQ